MYVPVSLYLPTMHLLAHCRASLRPMQFGFFVLNQWPPDEPMGPRIKEALEQVRAARLAGFDLLCTGQHFLSYPFQQPSTIPYLARLAGEAEGMAIAPLVLLLPLLQPVEVAESIATLDAMTDGRVVMGVGLGYREEENIALGSPSPERLSRLNESLALIKSLWTQTEVEFEGKYFRVPRMKIATRPVQTPHPPIWMAANADAAVKRSARQGYPWLINPHVTVPTAARQIEMYREVQTSAGTRHITDLPLVREVYVSTDESAALRSARPYLEPKYEAYARWGQADVLPGGETFNLPFEDLARDRFLIGSPEKIVREIERYESELGITHMILRMQWPGMPHAEVMRQIELFGERIIPRFGPTP